LTQATRQVEQQEHLRPEIEQLVNLVQDWQVEQDLREALQSFTEFKSVSQKHHYEGMQELSNELNQLYEEQQLSEALLGIEQSKHLGQLRPDLERIAALIQEWQAEQNLSEALQQVNLSPQQSRSQGLRAVVEGLSQLHDDQLLSEESITEAINDLRKTVVSLAAPKYQGMKELASAINDRHAAESIHEHLSLFHEATAQLRENLQHNPGLEKLAETVRSLRNNPAIAEAAHDHLQQISQRLREFGLNTTPQPKKLVSFWMPEYKESDRPAHIDKEHWKEWVGSCVHPEIIRSRLKSIEKQQVIERLLDKKLEYMAAFDKDGIRRKVGSQKATTDMNRLRVSYEPMAEAGGWWVDAGIDPCGFARGEIKPSDYGTFKPNEPRIDWKKTQQKRKKDPNAPVQKRKYENPMGIKQDLFERSMAFAVVPDAIVQRIFERYGVIQTPEEREKGFWYTVWKHPQIPIYRVEGDKKDAAVTSQGRVVISGQGVNAGYRAKDQFDQKLPERVLHPQLEMFAQPGREFRYAFDADTNPSTIKNVRSDMVRESELVLARGCSAYAIPWEPQQGKGVDDLIKISGPIAFEKADRNAIPIEKIARIHYRTQYNAITAQVRKGNPNISQEALDYEVYLHAKTKGDLKDGERFVSQSDHARSLKDSDQVQQYIGHIKAIAPQYLQIQSELAKAQATSRVQQKLERSEYETIAQRVRKDPSNINVIDQVIDLQVYLIAEAERGAGYGDSLIAQSDHVLNRPYTIDVQQYIDQIREHVSLHHQTLQDHAEYETMATEARAELPTEATPLEVDALVYFELRDQGRLEDSERILRFSPHLRSIESLDSAKQYLQKVRLASQHYEQDTVRRDRLIQRIKVGNDLVNLKVVEQLGLDVMAIMSNGQPYTNDKLFNFEKNRSGAIRISLKDGTTVYENGKVNPDVERAILDRLEFTLPKAMENIKRDIAQQVDQQKGMHRDRDIDLEQ
jgi:Fe-S-cluster formation regulator IscX/YfhJ